MGGPTAIRPLNRGEALRCTLATAADDEAIRRLLRENPMGGAIRLTFEREPSYFQSANVAGGEDQTVLVHAGTRLAAVGRCVRRTGWIHGEPRTTGYLGELRVDTAAQGRFGVLRDGYRYFQSTQQAAPADFYFTSIASDNERARRILESGARGLPRYEFLSELTTLLIAIPRSLGQPRLRPLAPAVAQVPELVQFLNAQARRCQLAAVWTEEMLHGLARHGLPLERFRLIWKDGRIAACAALWDQRSFRQTVIRGYRRPLTWARPLVNLVSRFLGTPRLPTPGSVLTQSLISPLALAEDEAALLPDLVTSLFPLAKLLGLEFLTVAFPTQDPRLGLLRRHFHTRAWPCRLYRVSWPELPGISLRQDGSPFLPDLALL